MRRTLAMLSAALLAVATAAAAPPSAKVTDVAGSAVARLRSGATRTLSIGDQLVTGDTVLTGRDGLVELDLDGLTIKVDAESVFTLAERPVSGAARGILAVILGAIKVRCQKITGQEPIIQTISCTVGIRGTEVDIVAAADGSAIVVVYEGQVTVEAEGTSVRLEPLEAVSVQNARPPGKKFKVLREGYRYEIWSTERFLLMVDDPTETVEGMRARLKEYGKSIREYQAQYKSLHDKLKTEQATLEQLAKKKGKKEADEYQKKVVDPLAERTAAALLNLRSVVFWAVSMRRYIGGRIYLALKSDLLRTPEDPRWAGFLKGYKAFLSEFEAIVAPLLEPSDL